MTEVLFDPDEHSYWLGDERLLSPSEVLSRSGLSPSFYAGLDPWYKERGTLAHEAIARAAKGEDPSPDPRVEDRVDRALQWMQAVRMKAVLVEHRLVCPSLRLAGTVDCVGWSDLGLLLVDWKATSVWPQNEVQLGGYRALMRSEAARGGIPLDPGDVNEARLAVVPLGSGAIARPHWVDDPQEAEEDFLAALRTVRVADRIRAAEGGR